MAQTIKITCDSKAALTIDELENFQGKLKSIDEDAFAKLKASILRYGFSFPVFVWGKKILDGHQRLAAVKQLIGEGYAVSGNKLHVVKIEAENERQAAEKLLLINSRYAKIDQQGFDVFVGDFDIELGELDVFLDIPEIDMTAPDFGPAAEDEQGKLDQLEPKIITCPHCGEKFDQRDVEN